MPWLTVHALAVAARRADVAGVVRLSVTPDALEIELLRVTSFSAGFAPAGVADPVTFRVPYTAVRGLVREGKVLYLALDPAAIQPYSRFALARFTDEPDDALAHAHEARARARWASLALPAPIGILAAAIVPGALASGLIGRASVGALAAAFAWVLLHGLFSLEAWGGPRSDRLRDRFEAALSERLALAPSRDAIIRAAVRAAPVPDPEPVPEVRPLRASPQRAATISPPDTPSSPWRSPVSIMIAATVSIVIVIGFVRRYAAERTPPPAVDRAIKGLAAAARAQRADVPDPPEAERCLCVRADSPLWKDGVPVLSVLTFESDEAATAAPEASPDRRGVPQYKFDLAIVNNGARPLRDVRITLTFARRTASGRRVGAVDRGLFWEGVLAPGRAAKWHVKAPGSEVRTDVSVTGTIERAYLDPAPADAYFALGSARARAVRVHAAVMLAYLRDPRAAAAARALAATGAADAVTLARVRRAAASVIACDVRRDGDRLDACVWNGSTQPKRGLSLREVRGESEADARALPIEGTVPVHEGLRVRLGVPADFGDEITVADPAVID